MDNKKLFQEFPPISTEQWKERIIKDLKGADYDKKLVWKTGEGFDVQPFYRTENLEAITGLNIFPGDFPFIRGNKTNSNEWLVRQDIVVESVKEANEKAVDIRLKGVDSLGFHLGNTTLSFELVDALLNNIRADVMELNFSTAFPLELVKIIDELAKKYNRDLDKIRGSVEFDPIGDFCLSIAAQKNFDNKLKELEDVVHAGSLLKNFHAIAVDGTVFQNSGSGIVSQLAFTLAKGSDYLTYLTNKGFEIDELAPNMRFHFSVGSNYFMEIAKFRAARYLWSKIVNAYGLSDADNAAMFIHCSNAQYNKTVYDPYVNMLRTTTETMSSVLGGINSMTVLPFNAVFEKTTVFSERIARNQQLVLKGESYFDKVIDPAAGSYFIENLTNNIIHETWKLFLEVQEKGGYLEAFKQGFILQKIQEEASAKDMEIAQRRRSILGTNQYPNTKEVLQNIDENIFSETEETGILKPCRGALAFEKLRYKTDKFASKNARPKAWMFTFGNIAMLKARSQFAGNFFGCAGFEIVDNNGFASIADGIAAAKKAKPELVVICSSDEEYAEIAIPVFDALKNETIVVLAGYPVDLVEKLKAAGMTNFIHVKSNVLEELIRYQALLGIK